MDNIDKKILVFLQENAKLTAKELASKLSLTPTPIYERIKKMEKQGIITKYVALVDPDLINKSLVVFINISVKEHDQKNRNEFIDRVTKLNQVTEFYQTSGTYDFMLKVRFASVKDYKDFLVNEIASIDNIGNIDSQIVLEEIKSTTAIVLN